MAVKYRRDGIRARWGNGENPYEVRPRLGRPNARQRLLIIYLGIGVFSVMLLLFHYTSQRQGERWLPERYGDGAVLEKRIVDDDGLATRYVLRVRVAVPPASPTEADFVPQSTPQRNEVLGPLELMGEASTTRESWEAVDEGTPIRVGYQINMRRSKIVVRSMYFDRGEEARADSAPVGVRESAAGAAPTG